MATGKPAEPTLHGIPPEMRANIFAYAVTTYEKRVVLGRKLLKKSQSDSNDEADEHAKDRFQAAILQHPLSMTCRLFRAEFSPDLQNTFSKGKAQSYDIVINNFDLEQIRAFTACKDTLNLNGAPTKLILQMDCNILASVEALCEAIRRARASHPEIYQPPIPENMAFRIVFGHRNHFIGNLHDVMSMSEEQGKKASAMFISVRLGMAFGSPECVSTQRLHNRFDALMKAHFAPKVIPLTLSTQTLRSWLSDGFLHLRLR